MKKVKKLMVHAYTQFNLGDDLFIKTLIERYPHTKFLLYAPSKYKLVFRGKKNISIFPSDSFLVRGLNFIFKKMKIKISLQKLLAKSCDASVLIGGSLFIQDDDWEEVLNYRKKLFIKNHPFFLLGANFGPYSDLNYVNRYKELFKEYEDICFREKYSYELFKDLDNVRMADDIIFQLNQEESNIMDNQIVISVIKPSIRKHLLNFDDNYYEKIKELVIYFLKKNYEITLMSFCEFEGDLEAVQRIVDLLPSNYKDKVRRHEYKVNLDETINLIAKSSLVVASRFHAMILGWVFNKPVFPMIYSNKMVNVMRDVDFKGNFSKIEEIQCLNPKDVFNCMETNIIDVTKQVKDAQKHFSVLDKYLM